MNSKPATVNPNRIPPRYDDETTNDMPMDRPPAIRQAARDAIKHFTGTNGLLVSDLLLAIACTLPQDAIHRLEAERKLHKPGARTDALDDLFRLEGCFREIGY